MCNVLNYTLGKASKLAMVTSLISKKAQTNWKAFTGLMKMQLRIQKLEEKVWKASDD